ncbi:WD40 repeat-like protein [Wallemia mellicola]|nr:WD40 repeat-like protein [Wallemia mellicola]
MNFISTAPLAGYNIGYSPFHRSRLAVACAANYGLVGNGRLLELSYNQQGDLFTHNTFDTQDGLFDLAWSEIHENQIVTAVGDGSIRLFDTQVKQYPIRVWHEHSREVFSLDWSTIDKLHFASASWDGTVKIWTPDNTNSLLTLKAHNGCVYNANFSPHQPATLATCGSDGQLLIWDLRTPQAPVKSIKASSTEILSLDWNKYTHNTLATSGVDKSIRSWDIRSSGCFSNLNGHDYAIRRVQHSPHTPNLIASASYDMTARVWDINKNAAVFIHDKHTEFVMGLAWSLFDPFVLTTCSWDNKTHLINLKDKLGR